MKFGIEFINNGKFKVRYNSPSREFSNLRKEFNIDASNLSAKFGPLYVAFSSGVDSQIILRSFLDQKLDVTPIFLHAVGYNDIEYKRVLMCEEFFKIPIKVYTVDIEQHKSQWLLETDLNVRSQLPFEYLSSKLENNWPIITQGAIEPAIVGDNPINASVYHNKKETMILRHALMQKHRKVIDFPYSPEAVASYYTDPMMKMFCNSLFYFSDSNVPYIDRYNTFAKPFVKGRYYGKDILWFNKLTGSENYPEWLAKGSDYDTTTRVSVPYWKLVNFLETQINTSKTFKDWIY